MACREAEFLALFIEGKLSPDVLSAIEAHLEACNGCFERVAEAALTGGQFGSSLLRSRPDSRLRGLLAGTNSAYETVDASQAIEALQSSFLQSYEIWGCSVTEEWGWCTVPATERPPSTWLSRR